jgi:hypothetical protein
MKAEAAHVASSTCAEEVNPDMLGLTGESGDVDMQQQQQQSICKIKAVAAIARPAASTR